ncbi:MAG: GxxExxY protein [Tsuneonella suprasediminis]|nr:GxxExxY protein [Altererythrobacter sp. N1]
MSPEHLENITSKVINCGFHIHCDLGPGLLESAYEAIMEAAIRQAGLEVERQVSVPLKYRGVSVDHAFRVDLLVEQTLIVELKSIERLAPVHGKQVLTYLRLMDLPLGLLMNFGQATFKEGLRRVANNYFGPFGGLGDGLGSHEDTKAQRRL